MHSQFEDDQDRIEKLFLTINSQQNYFFPIYEFIQNFSCSKFNGRTNILRLYPQLRKIKYLGFSGNAMDSLFLDKKNNAFLYISDHFLYIHPPDGRCVTEFISQQDFYANKMGKIASIPKYVMRSYDGHCIECHQSPGYRMGFNANDLNLFLSFLDNVVDTLKETKFLPHLIHPDRLLAFTEKLSGFESPVALKLVSLNSLNFIFSPPNEKKKILNATFSHPLSFLQSDAIGSNVRDRLNHSMCCNILDFLHSAFVTSLWIYTSCHHQNLIQIKRNALLENTQLKQNSFQRKSIPDDWERCNNPYGFCYRFPNKRKNIHNYGCLHLMKVLPDILSKVLEDASNAISPAEVEIFIQREITILKYFIINLKEPEEVPED